MASMAFLIASYGFHIVSVYSGVVLLSPSVYRCKITMLVRWYADNRLLFIFSGAADAVDDHARRLVGEIEFGCGGVHCVMDRLFQAASAVGT